MYPVWSDSVGVWLFTGTAFIWLGILSFFVLRQSNFLRSIFPKSGERDIRKKFEETLELVSDFRNDLGKFEEKLKSFEQDELKHIQKVALKRYNPYEDTGGNISFSLAFLDKDGNGFILTSLHARSGTRIFAKPVKEGKGGQYKLSQEEEETIEEAMEFNMNKFFPSEIK